MSSVALRNDHGCPRCGYDLAGAIRAWHGRGADDEGASCPLIGTCSECGLEFEWRFVMRPELAGPLWFVETPRSTWRWKKFRTWWHALVPWKFWRDVRMEVAQRPRALLLWFVLMFGVPGFITFIVFQLPGLVHQYNFAVGRAYPGGPPPGAWIRTISLFAFSRQYYAALPGAWAQSRFSDLAPAWVRVGVALCIGMPTMFLLLPWTRAQSKVRFSHVLRAAVYSVAPILVLFVWSSVLNAIAGVAALVFPLRMDRIIPIADRWDPFVIHMRVYWRGFRTLSESGPFAFLSACWFALWWACAFKIGFRMKDWKAPLLACLVPSLILAFLALLLDASTAMFLI